MGSYRLSYLDGVFSLSHNLFESINAVGKGEWFSEAVPICRDHGLLIDSSVRAIKTGNNQIKQVAINNIFSLINKIPWKKRVQVMNLMRKLFISY